MSLYTYIIQMTIRDSKGSRSVSNLPKGDYIQVGFFNTKDPRDNNEKTESFKA